MFACVTSEVRVGIKRAVGEKRELLFIRLLMLRNSVSELHEDYRSMIVTKMLPLLSRRADASESMVRCSLLFCL